MMPLFGPGSRGGVDTLAPKPKTQPEPPTKTTWRRLTVKDRPRCEVGIKRLVDEWGTGVPYVPAEAASWERRDAATHTYYCEDHKLDVELAEAKAAKTAAAEAVRPTGRRLPARRPR